MCTRRQAIQIVVEKNYGTIRDLKDRIGDFYDSFVMLGLISERLPSPSGESIRNGESIIEWEATELATEKARIFNLVG